MAKKKKSSEAENDEAAQEESGAWAEQEDVAEPESKGLGGDLQKQIDELEELIRESPLAAVGVAAGVGLLLGLLLNRR